MIRSRTCPQCGNEMLRGELDGRDGYACMRCHHSEHADAHTRQPARPRVPEAQVEREFDAAARAAGWTVLSTSRRRKRAICSQCGAAAWPAGGDGVSKGVPDRLLRRDGMPPGLWYGVELKGSNTPVSAEQRELAEDDAILIVRSYEEFHARVD